VVYSDLELVSETMNPFRHFVTLLGWEIGPLQSLCLHRTAQHRKNPNIHPCLERDSKSRTKCSSVQRHYIS